jgi:hypothetical protein
VQRLVLQAGQQLVLIGSPPVRRWSDCIRAPSIVGKGVRPRLHLGPKDPRMPRHASHLLAAVVVLSGLFVLTPLVLTPVAHADQPDGYGPSHPFDDALKPDDGPMEPMRSKAKIIRTRHGYRFTAGQQNTHLRLSTSEGKLRFRDTRSPAWKSLPKMCSRKRVSRGISASCRIPDQRRVLLEVHPRLGDDVVDGRGLSAMFEMAVLGDQGRDVMFGGKGKDFLNGAQHHDRASGGGGKDWIRGGDARDRLRGGEASDWIVGMSGRDNILGGGGKDRVFQ